MFEYLIEIESVSYDPNGAPMFAERVFHTIRASSDKEACIVGKKQFCMTVVNPYGEKIACTLRAVYRKGVLFDV